MKVQTKLKIFLLAPKLERDTVVYGGGQVQQAHFQEKTVGKYCFAIIAKGRRNGHKKLKKFANRFDGTEDKVMMTLTGQTGYCW